MGEKEAKKRESAMFQKNTILLNKIDKLETIIKKMRCCGNCSHRHYWGNELGCNLDLDKQFECDNNNKKHWEFKEEEND